MGKETTEVESGTALAGRAEFALLYAIIEEGVYRHDVGGVFSSLEQAAAEAKVKVLAEKDHYHDWLVLEFKVDQSVDDGELACTATWDAADERVVLSFEDGYST